MIYKKDSSDKYKKNYPALLTLGNSPWCNPPLQVFGHDWGKHAYVIVERPLTKNNVITRQSYYRSKLVVLF